MAQPPPYSPQTEFLTYQAQQAWFPGQNLDVEFNAIDTSIAAIRSNLSVLQRDDLSLGFGIVGFEQLTGAFQTQLINQGFAPTTPPSFASLDLAVATGLGSGLTVSQNVTGNSSGQQVILNFIETSADNANLGANFGLGLFVGINCGGPTMQGGREALVGTVNLNATSSASNLNRNYVGVTGVGQSEVPDNGTDATSAFTSHGAVFGMGGVGALNAGALNFSNVTGAEFNCYIQTGASAWAKTLAQFSGEIRDQVAGSGIDTMLHFYNQAEIGTAPGWKNGLLFTDNAAVGIHWPFTSSSTLLNAGGGASALGIGLDFFNTVISTALIRGPSGNFVVDGSGNVAAVGNINTNGSLYWLGRTVMQSPVDGNLLLTNQAISSFSLMQFGGTTASFPAIKRNGTAINFRLADDSGDASITCKAIAATGAALTIDGSGNLATSGTLITTNATAASSTATGALQVSGGIGAVKTSFLASIIATAAGGLQVGAPTGGDKGAGTLNLAGALFTSGTQVVSTRATGWTVATGTPQRSTFTTGGVTLAQLAGVVMALEQDLIAHGLIGT